MLNLRWLCILTVAGLMSPASPRTACAADGSIKTSPNPASKKLLIVAPISFHRGLLPFVAHKKKLLPTEMVALEGILKVTKGVDDAERLKRYLYDRWKKEPIGYVLLVGDAEVMPVRQVTVTVSDARDKREFKTFAPSELYYSDLAKPDGSFDDWNGNKEGLNAQYYGQLGGYDGKGLINVDGIDYLPDIALGRWPVHTTPQLEAVIAKTIQYESHVLADDLPAIRQAAFIVGTDSEDFRQKMKDWAKRLESVSTCQSLLRSVSPEGQPYKPQQITGEVAKVLDGGVGMIFHIGHGSPTCWDACLDVDQLKALQNATLPPVMFSNGCDTARFAPLSPVEPYVDMRGKQIPGISDSKDYKANPAPPGNYQRGKFNTSLGVEFVRSQKGGVAYIGCCAGSQGGIAMPLMDGFIEYVSQRDKPRLGDAWNGGIIKYYNVTGLATIQPKDWVQVATFHQAMKFQLFGDPSLRLPRKPKKDDNLLVNGSFEDVIHRKGELEEVKAGSTDIKGWKVINSVLIITGWEHVDGKQCLLLHGPDKRGGVEQTFKTTKGQRYRVSFSLSANPNNGRWPPELAATAIEVRAAGQTKQFAFDTTGKMPDCMGWVTREWEFGATDDHTTLAFSVAEAKQNFWHGPMLDNVRWEFEAADDHATLAFSAAQVRGNYWHGPALDNVRVVALPGK